MRHLLGLAALFGSLVVGAGGSRAALELAVATTSFEITGGLSSMQSCAPFDPVIDRYTIHSDAVLRSNGCWLFVVNRFQADNILTLNACNGYAVQSQLSLGNGSNPQDILPLADGRAYVTRYESDTLWIVDTIAGTKVGEIDLAAFADADGLPEMSQMARFGRYAFVGVQNLDRNAFFATTGSSALVVVDTTTDSVVDVDPVAAGGQAIQLQLQNPFWRMRIQPQLSRLVVIASGDFAVLDGGLELVDPHTLQSEAVILTETTLGGDILDAVIVNANLGYVLYSNSSFATRVDRFDPSTGLLSGNILQTAGFELSDLEVSSEGKLYIGDRRAADPGVRVFDAMSGVEIGGGPIDVGLPPFDIEPIRTTLVSVPQSQTSAASLTASPNVFGRSTTILLAGWTGGASPALDIFDIRGRRVRRLGGERGQEQWRYAWDGKDATGGAVASGKYWAVVENWPALRTVMLLNRAAD
jgi:hypothetical protein